MFNMAGKNDKEVIISELPSLRMRTSCMFVVPEMETEPIHSLLKM